MTSLQQQALQVIYVQKAELQDIIYNKSYNHIFL
jgi:hypothetical protein